MKTHEERRLRWQGCNNTRDIGGYPAQDGRIIRPGVLVRSDHLLRLTETGRRALVDYGVTTIIDLRHPREWEELPNPFVELGFPKVMLYPISDPDDTTGQRHISNQAELTLVYCYVVERYASRIATVIRAIAEAEGATLIHCHAGKDRTGIVVAIMLAACGVDAALIEEDYNLSNQYLYEPHAEKLEAARQADPGKTKPLQHEPRTARIRSVLELLDEQYGGAEAYLLKAGITAEQLARLREKFLQEN